ncbi:MAG TPA: chloride channel protein [Candidatus Binatia bacterium]|nr:chloride channel protein [Candidatus Binatia bacterium]
MPDRGRAALPVAPSLSPALAGLRFPRRRRLVGRRVALIGAVAVAVGVAAAGAAQALMWLIGLITNLAFYGRWASGFVSPAGNSLGALEIGVPVAGGLVVGLMARFGAEAIRGHGIPEAMEQVLFNESRIPPRITFLKPLSAAIAIGTGGPFGAEGPIIATGGALGSLVGQLLTVTSEERKTLLAAGAAAGMAATFGSPVSAVLLAVELLLFELRPRSVIPVALASATAAAARAAMVGHAAIFAVPALAPAGGTALAAYALIGLVVGVVSVGVTRAVYAVEDAFDGLPVHWMWWPALGGLAVGVVGLIAPHTLGVGYDNIENIVGGSIVGRALVVLCTMKFVSWAISLGSGTSGGTLAPLFTMGAGAGAVLGTAAARILPGAAIDPRMAAVVGMAALFTGASRAFLASVVFAYETTRAGSALLPLLAGCAPALLVSCMLMRDSIMTEKIARRGARVPAEYAADYLDQVLVRDAASRPVVTLAAADTLARVRRWMGTDGVGAGHQGFPVLDASGRLLGVLTRRDLLDPAAPETRTLAELIRRPPAVAYPDNSLREAADLMAVEGVGRLPVVDRDAPGQVVGMLTRSDLLAAHRRRLDGARRATRGLGGPPRAAAHGA